MATPLRRVIVVCSLPRWLGLLLYASKHGSGSSSSTADNTPGKFDYYQLTLSWAPEFCATQGSKSSFQRVRSQAALRPRGPWALAAEQQRLMAAKLQPAHSPSRMRSSARCCRSCPHADLIQHEWATHGTCSGLSTQEYFSHVQHCTNRSTYQSSFSRRNRNRRLVRVRSSRVSPTQMERHREASKSRARTASWWRSMPASARTFSIALRQVIGQVQRPASEGAAYAVR